MLRYGRKFLAPMCQTQWPRSRNINSTRKYLSSPDCYSAMIRDTVSDRSSNEFTKFMTWYTRHVPSVAHSANTSSVGCRTFTALTSWSKSERLPVTDSLPCVGTFGSSALSTQYIYVPCYSHNKRAIFPWTELRPLICVTETMSFFDEL
jgi:hypothetical protein